MAILNRTINTWILPGLFLLMAATRFHHFGSIKFLPDATLAVLFLAGFYLPVTLCGIEKQHGKIFSRLDLSAVFIFILLILEAGLIDFVAIRFGGVNDWCLTSAYLFLIPTYAVMFVAGLGCAQFDPMKREDGVKILLMLVFSSSVAFMISNWSFYLYSGRYSEISGLSYLRAVVPFYLPYMSPALFYSIFVLGFMNVLDRTLIMSRQPSHQ